MSRKSILFFAAVMIASLSACGGDPEPAENSKVEYVVKISNVSTDDTHTLSTGEPLPIGLSPGAFAVSDSGGVFFVEGEAASMELEYLAELGDPSKLKEAAAGHDDVRDHGIAGNIENADYEESPILPGADASFVLEFDRLDSAHLELAMMLGPSNDTFLAPVGGSLDLTQFLDETGEVDITDKFQWWDAGTEKSEPLGEGPSQASKAPDLTTGDPDEVGTVRAADGVLEPDFASTVKITIRPR